MKAVAPPLSAFEDENVYALAHEALARAGLHEGRFQARGVRGDYYEPPVPGFKVDDVRTHVKATREETRERKRGGHRSRSRRPLRPIVTGALTGGGLI